MRTRDRALAAAVLSVLAGIVTFWPYTAVVEPGGWMLISVTMIVVITLTGLIMRLIRSGRFANGLWPAAAQLIVGTFVFTLLLVPQGTILGGIPTGTTFSAVGRLATEAVEQVRFGTAPLDDTPGLRTMLALGFTVVVLLIDLLIAERVTLLAIVLIAMVGSIPMIVMMGGANLPWFVILALLALWMLRHTIRHDPRSTRRASTAVTLSVGAAAIAVALAVTPALPISTTWAGAGSSTQLDPSLRLGEDLRRPASFTVMTLATDASSAPYLRVASLSEFDGRTWTADEGDLQPISEGFGETEWRDDIEAEEQRTSIRVTGLSGSSLPVPYAATKIVGVNSSWRVMPDNRTVTSSSGDAADQDYTVTSQVARPTLEQIQTASAMPPTSATEVPRFVAESARQVTADATNDYDRLIAMQNWFRSEFTYSLDAPVDGDFDGTGAEAVEEFLKVRSGYCIHFAGAFALMAQALGMDVRIVVGYLPGTLTDQKRGDESIYTVASDQLHSWPEVRFSGIGWVPFEPTATLGTPTAFASESIEGTNTTPNTPVPTTAPSSAPTLDPTLDEDQSLGETPGTDSLQRWDPAPVLIIGGGMVLMLLLPLLVRLGVRLRRSTLAQRGDAASAWREVRAVLVDLNLPVSDADTPRIRGAELVERGADPADVSMLVDAVEHAAYARSAEPSEDLADPLARVSGRLRHSVTARDRIMARLLPRSLFVSRSGTLAEQR